MKTCDIEVAVAEYFGYLANIIIPNVSFGLNIHECDLLVLTKSGYMNEVEIKISLSDLRKDAQKRDEHRSEKIRRLWFAIPRALIKYADLIPERAGILVVDAVWREYASEFERAISTARPPTYKVNFYRNAKANSYARRISDIEREKLLRLGCIRIWSLKKALLAERSLDIIDLRQVDV